MVWGMGAKFTSGEHQIEQQQGRSNEPVNVTDVEDLSVDAGDFWIAETKSECCRQWYTPIRDFGCGNLPSDEFNVNGRPAKVRSHGEVCNSCQQISVVRKDRADKKIPRLV